MFEKIASFFMAIIMFFMQLFGITPKSKICEYKDLAYGENKAQVMDLYFPDDVKDNGLVVFIHGGAWISGDKEGYLDSVKYCADTLGIAAATINYRMLDEGFNCNDMMEDVTLALNKIKEVTSEKGVNIKNVAFGGASAGAHIALLYSYKYFSESPFPVAFCFDMCGPADLADPAFYINNDMGTEFAYIVASLLCGTPVTVTGYNFFDEDVQSALKSVSPAYYVNENTVPTLIAHGAKDTTVPYSNTVTLVNALDAAGVRYDLYTYPNSNHGLANDPDVNDAFYAKLHDYVNEFLK